MLRYMSHFQSVHRGQFFTTMKTTTVRKLLPESWGFLCPVKKITMMHTYIQIDDHFYPDIFIVSNY